MTRFQMQPFLAVALIALGVAVSGARADEPAPPAPGTRVRLTAPSVAGKRLVGNVVGLDDATLTLRRDGAVDTMLVPRSAITRVEVSRHRSRKGKAAAIGMLVGLGAAVAVGLAVGDNCASLRTPEPGIIGFSDRLARSLCHGKGETAALSAILTVPLGMLFGAVAAPGEKWEASSMSRLQMAIAPARDGGLRAAITVRF
jgi:hypothetical protein